VRIQVGTYKNMFKVLEFHLRLPTRSSPSHPSILTPNKSIVYGLWTELNGITILSVTNHHHSSSLISFTVNFCSLSAPCSAVSVVETPPNFLSVRHLHFHFLILQTQCSAVHHLDASTNTIPSLHQWTHLTT
jgi:hypothetical protein